MATTTSISVTVEPPALARVDAMGMRQELEKMLDFLQRNMPGLLAVRVELDERADRWEEPTVMIWTHLTAPRPENDARWDLWGEWFIRTFSPDVVRHFVRMTTYEATNGR